MKILHTLLFVLFFAALSFSQNLMQVKISLNSSETVSKLLTSEIPIDEGTVTKDNQFIIFINTAEKEILNQLGINYEILIPDWKTHYKSYPILSDTEKHQIIADSKEQYGVEGFGFGSMGGFYTYNEVVQKLDSMAILYPNIITPKWSIGTSHEGRNLWVVKISDNPNQNENEPQTFFDGLIHAREPQSMATIMYFMYYLLENYGTDPEVTYLVNNREIYFLPVNNPDGYEYNKQTDPNGGGDWRKNRRNNSGSYGVDLNRNFGYMWGYDNVGSSSTPSSETYRGPSAFSEPEAFYFRDFVNSKNIKTHINYHSYNNSVIYPWGYINQLTPDSDTYIEFASYMCQFNGYNHGNSTQTLGYQSNGTVRDWMYGEQNSKGKIFSYTVEVGSSSDGFWPPQSRIFPLAQGNLRPNLFKTWVAGEYVRFISATYNKPHFLPGDSVVMNPTIKNQGLSTGFNINVELISLNPSVTVINPVIVVDSVQARNSNILSPGFTFLIDNSIPHNQPILLVCRTSSGGNVMSNDTISLPLGMPVYRFIDTTSNISQKWTVSASPSTQIWGTTSSSFISSPNSYTDSPSGNYVANATVTMTLTENIDLYNAVNPKLNFWTKYDMESNWDYGQVKISTNNGTSWIPLQGLYTELGTGSFQPNGQPLYDGTRTTWVKEEINLTPYIDNNIKLRFELKSDGSQQRDGWYLDDIGILTYSVIPVELVSLKAYCDGDYITLAWQTASETNNRGFEIQKKSRNGWVTLSFVDGKGTSSETNSYLFIDKNPLVGKNIYRLKQIDFDGSQKIYEDVETDFALDLSFNLEQNYPNPFNPETVINFQIPQSSKVTLEMFNIMGEKIITLIDETKEAGDYSFKLSAGKYNLSSGVYFYQLSAGSNKQIKKLILLK